MQQIKLAPRVREANTMDSKRKPWILDLIAANPTHANLIEIDQTRS